MIEKGHILPQIEVLDLNPLKVTPLSSINKTKYVYLNIPSNLQPTHYKIW